MEKKTNRTIKMVFFSKPIEVQIEKEQKFKQNQTKRACRDSQM